METTAAQKSLERVISQKAFQMSSSTPCKVWVLGFFCGVCITYLFLACLTPFRTEQFGLIFSRSSGAVSQSSSMIYSDFKKVLVTVQCLILGTLTGLALISFLVAESDQEKKDVGTGGNYSFAPNFSQRKYIYLPKEKGTLDNSQGSETQSHEERVLMLYSAWSAILDEVGNIFARGLQRSNMPQAPHLENCRSSVETNKRFDNRGENGSLPPWTLWKGLLGLNLLQPSLSKGPDRMHFVRRAKSEGAYPPWIVGSDEDNFPLTRQVQRDIWIHQHPQNCNDPNLRFLIADWERLPGFGMGAQLAGMAGMLAIAVNEKRILVTNYYNRADHSSCQGSSRSHWSCYFFPETSFECQKHAFDLLRSQEAWKNGIITVKENYTSKEIWAGRIPRVWGDPWSYLQPTTDIGGNLLTHHHKMDRRWWRAQAIRYLMRFQSEYTCGLLNMARHKAFGLQAAKMVVENLPVAWPKVVNNRSQADIERFVWSNHKPWIPRPLLSMHVRMGDKACEMKVVGFENYMQLAERIRERFPDLNSEVIDKSRLYPHWNFYYTNVTRQIGNMTMATYEASLGRETSTNYPLVNFMMATEADFFIGALGSTWCYLIDGMRNTGGKVMAGYLSVNKDRFW